MLAAVAGILLPHIPALIDLAEKLIRKPKSGDDKMDAVVQAVRTILGKYAAVEGATDKQPSDEELRGLIQGVYARMQSGAAAVETGKLFLVRGSVVEITTAP